MHPPARGLSMLELITMLGLLTLGLALVVSVARHVRSLTADDVTRKNLTLLEQAARAYEARWGPRALPEVPLPDGTDEPSLRRWAPRTTELAVVALRRLPDGTAGPDASAFRDGWGSPIARVGRSQQQSRLQGLGSSPAGEPFFLSAGPDRRYRTQMDNLYSYDQLPPGPATGPLPPTPPALPPARGLLDNANNAPEDDSRGGTSTD